MPSFRYVAVDQSGQLANGTMEAASEADVVARLQRQGQIPMRAELASRTDGLSVGSLGDLLRMDIGGTSLRRQEVANLTRELSIMLTAGQDLDRSLRFLVETAPNARVRRTLDQLRATVRDGGSLATALGQHQGSFTQLYIGLVRAGEAGGTLAPTLDHLALVLERERALSATVTSAMIYPGLLSLVAIGSITLLLTTVLPQFVPLFEQNGARLPWATQLMIDAGAFVSGYGLHVLAVLALSYGAFRLALRRPGLRRLRDGLLLHLPISGALAREVLAARFTRTLGTLVLNGVPLIAALTIVRDAIGNLAGVRAVDLATVSAQAGAGLSGPLGSSGIFPLRTIYLMRLGEETAQLGGMALRAAEIHEEKVRIGVQRLISLLVPLITIVMGAAVAAIVSSLLLAMLSLNDLAQ